jgi:predicted branched-subunit amino acid permease
MQNDFNTWSFLFLLSLFFVLLLIYSIRECARDARRRGRSPVLVAVLVIVLFPLGLIVWFAIRPAVVDRSKRIGDVPAG